MNISIVSSPPGNLFVDKIAWLESGFRSLGHDTYRVHQFGELQDADRWAHIVLFDQYAAGCPPGDFPAIAEDKRAIWAQCWRDMVCTDPQAPVTRQDTFHGYARVMRAMDAVFIKERHRADEFRAAGIRALYLDCQGAPESIGPCQHAEQPEWDVLVLGQADRAYADRRSDAADLVKAGYRVLWAGRTNTPAPNGVHGHAWVHPTQGLSELAGKCAVALSVDLRCEAGYTSDRTWLLAATGIPLVCRVPEVDSDLGLSALAEVAPQADVASWIYSNRSGLLKCVAQAVKSPADRQRRGEQGRRAVLDRHLYKHRAEAILQTIESLQAARAA